MSDCYFCAKCKRYMGFPFCVANPEKPVILYSYPDECGQEEKKDYRKNCPIHLNKDQKEYVNTGKADIVKDGDCKNCSCWLEHLNFCTMFGDTCSEFGHAPECPRNENNWIAEHPEDKVKQDFEGK